MIRKALILIAVLASSIGFAQDNFEDSNEFIDEITSNETFCVQEYVEDKIYLNPDCLYPTPQGLYLNLNDHEFLLLPSINSDSQGCYIKTVGHHPRILNICPGCQRQYFVSCSNPDCPLVKQKQERERDKEYKKQEQKKAKRAKK